MKYIKLFEEIENFSGREAFPLFLRLIDNDDNMFLRNEYLNVDDYSAFFITDKIKSNYEIIDELELKMSLRSVYEVMKDNKNKLLSFYFGIKKNTLEYGFYDNREFVVLKCGQFEVSDKYFKSLNNKCLLVIKKYLDKQLNLKMLSILQDIKKDFNTIFNGVEGNIKILDKLRIKNTFDTSIFNPEDLEESKFQSTLEIFKENYPWGKKVDAYVSIEEDRVNLFFKLKEKVITMYDVDDIPTIKK